MVCMIRQRQQRKGTFSLFHDRRKLTNVTYFPVLPPILVLSVFCLCQRACLRPLFTRNQVTDCLWATRDNARPNAYRGGLPKIVSNFFSLFFCLRIRAEDWQILLVIGVFYRNSFKISQAVVYRQSVRDSSRLQVSSFLFRLLLVIGRLRLMK